MTPKKKSLHDICLVSLSAALKFRNFLKNLPKMVVFFKFHINYQNQQTTKTWQVVRCKWIFLHVAAAADLNLNNRFKHVPVHNLSCSPLAKKEFWISKDCILKLIVIDSEIAPLDIFPNVDGFDLQSLFGLDNLGENCPDSDEILSLAPYYEDLNNLNLKLTQFFNTIFQKPTN